MQRLRHADEDTSYDQQEDVRQSDEDIVADILTIAHSSALNQVTEGSSLKPSLADHLAEAEEKLSEMQIPEIVAPYTDQEMHIALADFDQHK